MSLQILRKDDLPLGGFAGITEHRLVKDQRLGGGHDTWDGLGNFVYLADARYLPHGESGMHPHKEIDVISVVVEGRLVHEGSMEHGRSMIAGQAQAQRAGGDGFQHNEINPDADQTRMIQLWALPQTSGEPASYRFYDLKPGKVTRIYGGHKGQVEMLDSPTTIEVGILTGRQAICRNGPFLLYVVSGIGKIGTTSVNEGDLIRGEDLDFEASQKGARIIVITIMTPNT